MSKGKNQHVIPHQMADGKLKVPETNVQRQEHQHSEAIKSQEKFPETKNLSLLFTGQMDR